MDFPVFCYIMEPWEGKRSEILAVSSDTKHTKGKQRYDDDDADDDNFKFGHITSFSRGE